MPHPDRLHTHTDAAEHAAQVEAGLDLALNAHATIGVSYTGQIARNVTDDAAKGKSVWKF